MEGTQTGHIYVEYIISLQYKVIDSTPINAAIVKAGGT